MTAIIQNDADHFWRRVAKSDGCWAWTGEINGRGYGVFSRNRRLGIRRRMAHRVSWELTNGAFDQNLYVCHKCDNPRCVRPDHLFLGTQKENIRDCVAKGRFNHFKGAASNKTPLREKDVVEIRRRAASGEHRKLLADYFGVQIAAIYRIINRDRWAHVA